MKHRLLDILRCPTCARELSLETWKSSSTEVVEGLLHCVCGESYPIIGGVPRMLVGDLRRSLPADYGAFWAANGHRLPATLRSPVQQESAADAVSNTQASFGFEWTKFSQMRPEWEKNFWGYFAPHTKDFFESKTILDAGCGMGRHLYYSSQHGREVVGVDFSRSVDAAYLNTRHLPRAHVVQADLSQLPFAPETFDLVYSLGVLHHVPCPDGVFSHVLQLLKANGEVRVYVYRTLTDAACWRRALLSAVTRLRSFTTKLPHGLLYAWCYPIALGAWATFVLPGRVLSQFRFSRTFAETLPLSQYVQYPFGVLLNDQFDRFSAPLERRYSAAEVRAWLERAGVENITIAPHWGWIGHGRKPQSRAVLSQYQLSKVCAE